jgi:hypothetical protein
MMFLSSANEPHTRIARTVLAVGRFYKIDSKTHFVQSLLAPKLEKLKEDP